MALAFSLSYLAIHSGLFLFTCTLSSMRILNHVHGGDPMSRYGSSFSICFQACLRCSGIEKSHPLVKSMEEPGFSPNSLATLAMRSGE